MPIALSDIITPTAASEVEASILSLCATAGLPTSSWQSGSVIRTIIAVVAQAIADKSTFDVEVAKGGLGDYASAAWAKLWAQQTFNVDYVPAAAATGAITVTNASATTYTLNPGDLIVAHYLTGATYRNQAALTLTGNSTVTNVAISADIVGTASNAAPSEIQKVVTSLIGVSVTNPLAVLGADEEATAALVSRARAKLAVLSPNGVKNVYDYVARTPLYSATSTPITRTRTVGDPSTGLLSVYLATSAGAPTSGDIAIVQAAMDAWATPWCVTATAYAATTLPVPITYQIWAKTSLTAAQVQSNVANALATYFAGIPVGGNVVPPDTGAIYVESLTNIIHDSVPGTQRVKVTLPAADLFLSSYQVPVLGTITGTFSPL